MFSWLHADTLPVGSTAPDFTLADDSGHRVQLSELRGRNVVLVFYPGDDTPGCTKQLCQFRDRWSDVKTQGAEIFGINPQSAAKHRKFRDKFNFPFPLLVDENKKVAELYRCSGLIVRRTVYVVGPDGCVRFAKRGMPEPAEVLAACA